MWTRFLFILPSLAGAVEAGGSYVEGGVSGLSGLAPGLGFCRGRGLSRVGGVRIGRELSIGGVVWRGNDLAGATEIVEN